MQKSILYILALGFVCLNANPEVSNASPTFSHEKLTLEYTIVRVKYSLKKVGVVSQVYIDIGNSQKHSLAGVFEIVSDGVFKIGFGKEIVVLSNEVDMLNYFAGHGWEVVRISELKIMSTNFTQYLFSKESH